MLHMPQENRLAQQLKGSLSGSDFEFIILEVKGVLGVLLKNDVIDSEKRSLLRRMGARCGERL